MTYNRKLFLQFIEMYKDHPCLWKVTDPNYHNKTFKNRAYNKILQLFKTKDPKATKELVLKKINSMRGSFRKEVNKVKVSEALGPENVHVPKLWYFNHLMFLEGKEPLKTNPDTIWTTSSMDEHPPCMWDEMPIEKEESSDPFENQASQSSQHSSSSKSSTVVFESGALKLELNEDQVLDEIDQQIEQPIVCVPNSVENSKQLHDAYGEHVAEKLRALPSAMVPFCQKLINDALFLAELQSLNISSRIVTDTPIVHDTATTNKSYKLETW